ncbi:hypothetical protein DTO013E5_6286 [Penicillium roqueforti]|nr:hypothetical protein CBS147337_8117 [Penicillium roqueforti]KAI2674098.1 hypothetical protein CBS147355_7273 [Penicillium roqueforti]KAI2714106.1 hypothetical protein CBS147318_6847 [Penicillium roqueforti]KAI2715812.1 hypothetical protein CBS147354_7195 [Penicillium roqueforti]KAI2739312.1 hypothetical protein DTO012A1_6140 [Penicillium roqueforti]
MPDPSAEGNCDIETSVPVQWHTTETSIAIQPKSREGDSFGPPAQKNLEVSTSTLLDMSAQYDRGSEVQTGILCDSCSENDQFHTPSSSQKDPSAMLNTFPGGSSDGYSSAVSNSSSGAKSESSSIESFDKSSQHDAESEEEEEKLPSPSSIRLSSSRWPACSDQLR